jgi:hypothetical protein
VDEHWKAYRELALQSKVTGENVKKILTPAIEGLGLKSLAAIVSIDGFARRRRPRALRSGTPLPAMTLPEIDECRI